MPSPKSVSKLIPLILVLLFACVSWGAKSARVDADSESALTPDATAYAWYIAKYKSWSFSKMHKEADKFAKMFPNSIFADNVYYLAGQHMYLKKKCRKAAKVWSKVVKKFPHSNKRIESEYGFAICQIQLSQKKKGLDLLKRIVRRYPNSQQAKKAKLVMKSL